MGPLVDPIKEIQAAILGLNHRLRTIEERLEEAPLEPYRPASREWAVGDWLVDHKLPHNPRRILDMTEKEVALGRRVDHNLQRIDIEVHPRGYLDHHCLPSQPAAWFSSEED